LKTSEVVKYLAPTYAQEPNDKPNYVKNIVTAMTRAVFHVTASKFLPVLPYKMYFETWLTLRQMFACLNNSCAKQLAKSWGNKITIEQFITFISPPQKMTKN
jgi:hypothetical protein